MAQSPPTYTWLLRFLIRGPGWTSITVLVVTLVLVGGVLPAAYGYGLPHDHIYLGGAPSVSSEQHHHDNPLAVVLGPLANLDEDAPSAAPAPTSTQPFSGKTRVLSEYSGVSSLVLSAIGVAVLAPVLEQFERRDIAIKVTVSAADLAPLADDGPAPPPPRAYEGSRS